MNNYGYQQYKQQSINTMTQGELLIILYDEAIKRLSRAEIGLINKDFNLFDTSIDRVIEIIRYLNNTLNQNFSISIEIERLYDFFLYQLSRIKASRNSELINEIKPMITELRDTFKEADRISRTGA